MINDNPMKEDNWIEWGGGYCPCPNAKKIRIRFQDLEETNSYDPKGLRWWWVGNVGDIVAYRVVKS